MTRDLDLFWHGRSELGELVDQVTLRLRHANLDVERQRTEIAFAQLLVRDQDQSLVVDLVADSVPVIVPPIEFPVLPDATILVDSPHEILVNKLCALLSRKELRDLRDVRLLMDSGENLNLALALRDAPRKDSGFSPLMIAWVLRGLEVREMAQVDSLSDPEVEELSRFRDELVELIVRQAAPE